MVLAWVFLAFSIYTILQNVPSFYRCYIVLVLLGSILVCSWVNAAPRLQHCCSSCDVCCHCTFVCWRICGRLFCCVVAFTWFQCDGLERNISLWFSWPLYRERAKLRTWAGVRTSESSSIWIAVLFIFAIKKSFIRFSSTFPRAALEPSSRSLLKNISRFSFFCTVISWKRSNVIFLGHVIIIPNS